MFNTTARTICLLLTACMSECFTPLAWAQGQTTGAIQGRVYEIGTDLPIPSAVISVRNEDSGLERTTITGADGIYFIGTIPPGFYTISAARQGYESDQTSLIKSFPVRLSKTNLVQPPPIGLRRAGAAAPVTGTPSVQASRSGIPRTDSPAEQMVNTTNATRGGNFDRRQLLALPLPGIRTFDDLAFLLPGVSPPPQASGKTVGPGIGKGVGTSGQFSINGLRSRANNFTVDGSDNNDEDIGVRRQGFTSLVPQPIESLQEFQAATLLPDPQFGRNMAGQINAVSRSGGASYSGTIYGFVTDKRLKERDFFDLAGGPENYSISRFDGVPVLLDGQPLTVDNPVGGEDAFTRGQYGFVFGGPLVRQQTHFFASVEHQRLRASKESSFAVPTTAERGVFSSGDTGIRSTIGEPVFPSSIAGGAFFSLFPFPNNPVGPYGPNTYTAILPADAHGTILSIKLDHNIKALGRDHSLTARWAFADDDTILPVTGEALFSTLRAKVRAQNLSIMFNSALSVRTSNQARFSYGRTRLGFKEVRSPFLKSSRLLPDEPFLLNAPLLVNGTLPGGPPSFFNVTRDDPKLDTEAFTGPIGQVIVSGYNPIGVDVFNFPQGRTNNTFQYADTLVYNSGRHRVTVGADVRRTQLNSFLDRNFRPLAVFSGALDIADLIGSRRLTPRDFYVGSDFVAAGAPTGFFQTLALVPDSSIGLRYWQNNLFVANQIRVRRNFTLTVGARYELNTVPTEVNRRIESTFTSPEVQRFSALENEVEDGVPGLEQFLAGRTRIFKKDVNNLAPHIAFAWDPSRNGKTSIRGGYGIYYDQIPGAVISQSRNVFPSFLPLDLAGVDFDRPSLQFAPLLSFVNPSVFAVRGTLNTFDQAEFGDFMSLLRLLKLFNHAGPGFTLPAFVLETPYSQQWGLTIEQQLKKDFMASAAYVGTRGVHLLRFATPNLGPNSLPVVNNIIADTPIAGRPDFRFPQFHGIVLPPHIRPSRRRPFPLLGSFTSIEADSNSTYHSLQLQLNKRFARGIQFTTAYTWSHAIDEVSDLFDLAGARTLPQNSRDRRAERGDANFDIRQRFVYSAIWELPFFTGNWMLGGWQLASIGTFQTGQPYTIIHCCDVNLDGNLTDRLNTVEAIKPVNNGHVRFNFEPTGPPVAMLGDDGAVGRNTFRTWGIATVDLTINKSFDLGERQRLELRSEFYNVFNRTHFGVPVHQIGFSWLGRAVDTRVPARTIQLVVKYNF